MSYEAQGNLDYGTSPRATPLVHGKHVYFQGAFGHLHCVQIDDGIVVWKKSFVDDFQAEVPTWGWSSSPLLVDDKLIVNPGAKDASLVALDPANGKVIWKCAGEAPGYSSFIVATLGGVRQIVGYDKTSLGGWDIKTGKRLWTYTPPRKGDFNVPTPIAIDGKLLVSSENNGTRLFEFDDKGMLVARPIAEFLDLAPNSHTPVVVGDRLFGIWGKMFCLDVTAKLKPIWTGEDAVFQEYAAMLASPDRVVIFTQDGELLLLDVKSAKFAPRARLKLFEDERGLYSHPAVVGKRLYVRGSNAAACLELTEN